MLYIKRTIIIAIYSLFAIYGISQPTNMLYNDGTVPTPSAASLGKYADIPVSHFTGVPSIGIPIYTIQDGPLTLPISLNYHASGVALGEPASFVGLGWSLNAGGMITRTVLGLPDERPGGFYTNGELTTSSLNLSQILDGTKDGESDIYTFNFAGYSGKMVLNNSGDLTFLPKSDLIAEMDVDALNSEIDRFTITTTDGTKYYFGNLPGVTDNAGIEKTMTDSNINTDTGNNADIMKNSTWYLMKIESYDAKFDIVFEYENETYGYRSLSSCYYQRAVCGNTVLSQDACIGWQLNSNKFYLKNYVQGKRISKITASNETINFIESTVATDRRDLRATGYEGATTKNVHSLDKITISSGGYIKEWDFTTSYFRSSGNSPYDYRLKLESVQEKGSGNKPAYEFSYYGNQTSGGYQFLPGRLSKALDHWGYYNGKEDNEDEKFNLPPTTVLGFQYGNSDRSTDSEYVKYGVLDKVLHPTGGAVYYDFEANQYEEIITGTVPKIYLTNCETLAASACCEPNATMVESDVLNGITADVIQNGKFKLSIRLREAMDPPVSNCLQDEGIHAVMIEAKNANDGTIIGLKDVNINANEDYKEEEFILKNLETSSPFIVGENYEFILTTTNGQGVFDLYVEYNQTTTLQYAGGLRIAQITASPTANDNYKSSPANDDIIRTFTYDDPDNQTDISSGFLYRSPAYGFNINGSIGHWNANSIIPLGEIQGYHIGYENVTEHLNGNGRREFTYKVETVSEITEYPITPTDLYVHMGTLENQQIFKEGLANPIQENIVGPLILNYENISGLRIKAAKFSVCPSGPPLTVFNDYYHRNDAYQIDEEITIIDGVSTTQEYEYDGLNQFLMPTKITSTNSDGVSYGTEFIYNYYYPAGTVKDYLLDKNIIGAPFEIKKLVGSQQIDGTKTSYSFFDGNGIITGTVGTNNVYPSTVERFEFTWDQNSQGAGSYQPQGTFNEYDNTNFLPKKYTAFGWDMEEYEWGSGGVLTKRTYDNLIWNYEYYGNSRLLKKKTDIDNVITNYTYDNLFRLSKIDTRANNIIQNFTYGYERGSENHNFVMVENDYVKINSDVDNISSISYLDGLGREIQSNQINHFHQTSPSGEYDVVTISSYDNQGRVDMVYEPLKGGVDGAFYTSGLTGKPFTKYLYEASPLNRVISTTSPSWFATTVNYGANSSAEAIEDANGFVYAPNSLAKTITTDPEGIQSITFLDKRGRTVATRNGQGSALANTKFAYDFKDRVAIIVPPGTDICDANLRYEYLYDGDDNVIVKKVPDCNPEIYAYDDRNLLVAMQHGNLLSLNQWQMNKYDNKGRVIESGFNESLPMDLNTPTISKPFLSNIYDVIPGNSNTPAQYTGRLTQSSSYVLNAAGVSGQVLVSDFEYDVYGRMDKLTKNNHVGILKEVYEYDYDYADNMTSELRSHKAFGENFTILKRYDFDAQSRLVTSKIRIGNNPTKIISEVFYNEKDLVSEKNIGGSGSGALQSLDYSYLDNRWLSSINDPNLLGGKVSIASCTVPNPGTHNNLDNNDVFYLGIKYDENNSAINASSQKNGNIAQLEWEVKGRRRMTYGYQYDQLNRLKGATFGEYDNAGSTITKNDLYTTGYDYDIRGNLTYLSREGMVDDNMGCYNQAVLDNLTYNYNNADPSNQFDNISDDCSEDIHVTGIITEDHTYSAYDEITSDANITEGNNITFKGGGGIILQGGFTYSSAGGGTFIATTSGACTNGGSYAGGYDAPSSGNYVHDNNGNLTSDPSKSNTIAYNYLNLPYEVVNTANSISKIKWTYSHDGIQLQKEVYTNGTLSQTQDYIDGVEYSDNSISAIYFEDGRARKDGNTWKYDYYIKDHLGNARLVISDVNGSGKIDVSSNGMQVSEVMQESHYYPFGMKMEGPWMNNGSLDNDYLYNGKEIHEDGGLDWYSYGARMYDPTIARWTAVDPMSELYTSHSPYSYVLNRPINAIDPDGRLVIFINGFTPNRSNQGSRSYWGSFASRVERHFGENPNRSLFIHGGNNTSRGSRIADGFVTGAKNADQILDMIVDENGNVTETIKVMTHSMGAAFGKGFVKALLKAAKRRGVKGVPITLVADFDPFQAAGLSAESGIFTQEFSQLGGLFANLLGKPFSATQWLANQSQDGEDERNNDNSESSHALKTFGNNIDDLKEGTYKWNGKEWECSNCKD